MDASKQTREFIVSMPYQGSEIPAGTEVFGADGEKVGAVAAAYPGYIVVEKGIFFPTDYYIPTSAIASYDGDQLYLSVPRDAALQSGWDAVPADLETATFGTTMTTDTTDMTMGTARVDAARGSGDEEIAIPVREEELTATVRAQEAGAVRIGKDIVTEQRSIDVPITEERVRVERRVVDRAVNADDAEAFTDTVIEVPLRSEVVDVQKTARVTGEVVLNKEAVERTERVTDTVRREEVFVDESEVVDSSHIEGGDRQ